MTTEAYAENNISFRGETFRNITFRVPIDEADRLGRIARCNDRTVDAEMRQALKFYLQAVGTPPRPATRDGRLQP
jgi:hypothetical protein